MNIAIDASLVGLERRPIDVPGMVLGEKDGPFCHGQKPRSFPEHALFIHVTFMTRFSVGVSASIHRIGEHAMDAGISRGGPTDLSFHVGTCGKGKALSTEPKPNLACRSQFGELRKHGADGADHRLVGMKAYFAIFFSPHKANR
jgi:hypothetical protein